jgi:preflagellin peptidase FlaK
VVEDIEEQDGRLVRRFISFSEYSRRRLEGDRITTIEDLTAHPEHYGDKLDLYQKAGHVWISHSIPFIVLITAGYFSALIAGDLLGALILTLVETIL